MDLVRELIGIFSFNAPRNHVLQQSIEEIQRDSQRLKKLCDTHFTEKHSSILTILKLLPALQLAFQHFSPSTTASRESRQHGRRLLSSVEKKFKFVINLQALD